MSARPSASASLPAEGRIAPSIVQPAKHAPASMEAAPSPQSSQGSGTAMPASACIGISMFAGIPMFASIAAPACASGPSASAKPSVTTARRRSNGANIAARYQRSGNCTMSDRTEAAGIVRSKRQKSSPPVHNTEIVADSGPGRPLPQHRCLSAGAKANEGKRASPHRFDLDSTFSQERPNPATTGTSLRPNCCGVPWRVIPKNRYRFSEKITRKQEPERDGDWKKRHPALGRS